MIFKILIIAFIFNPWNAFSKSVISTISWEEGVNQSSVKGWIASVDKVNNISSTTYIRKKFGGKDKLHRKGHRDVIVWIPGSTDLSKEFIMILWFHGHYGYVPRRTFQDRTLKQFVPFAQSEKSKNFVVVIPEMPWSVHTRTPTKRNSQLWLQPGDFLGFVKQINEILQQHLSRVRSTNIHLGKIDYKIVGHSAGGSTIKRLGITGDLCKLNPSVVVWSDSSYGKWLDNAWDGCLKNSNIQVKIFVYKGGAPWRQATRFLGTFQDPPINIEFHIKRGGWSHKLIGNNIVKLSRLMY